MKKLVYQKQNAQHITILINGICGFCGEKNDCVVVNSAGYSVCKDCAKQITRIVTNHGPATGQIPADGAVENVPF